MRRPKRAMLLCAGKGTRLAPLTDEHPKPLVHVLNQPMLLYNLMLLRSAGIEEVMVNVHHLPERIPQWLGDGERYGLRIHYHHESTLLGTGGGLVAVRDFLVGDGRPCIVANGDTLCEANLAAAVDRHLQRSPIATLLLHPHPHPEHYGAVHLDDADRVIGIDHIVDPKPLSARRYVFGGVYVLESTFFEHLTPEPSCALRTSARQWILEGEEILGDPCITSLFDCGTPERLITASSALLDNPGLLAHARRIQHHPHAGPGTVIEPVLFGDNVYLDEGVVVGPHVVLGDDVVVEAPSRLARVVALGPLTIDEPQSDAFLYPPKA